MRRSISSKKKKEACIGCLNQAIKLSLAAHDIESVKRIHMISALVFIHFNNPYDAVDHYKHLRNLVEATDDAPLKMHVYYQFGMCYQLMKEYKKAIKAFK